MKLKTFTRIFFLFLISCTAFGAIAQDQKQDNLAALTDVIAAIPKVKSAEWQVLQNIAGVVISYKYESCSDKANGRFQEYAILEAENTLTMPLSVSLEAVLWYDNACINCDRTLEGLTKQMVLQPGEKKAGECFKNDMAIFSAMQNGEKARSLTNFSFKNISVGPIK